MSKREKTLSAGLNTLLGGANAPKAEAPAADAAPAIPQARAEEAAPEAGMGLIDTITDEQLREVLLARQYIKRGRPRKDAEIRQKESELYKRTTLIISKELLAKLKEIGYREHLTLKEIVEGVLGDAVKIYEEKNGVVTPKKHKGNASLVFSK